MFNRRGGEREPSHYKNAQVCLNGHAITSNTEYVERVKKFCPDCGEKTIDSCLQCSVNIQGSYFVPGVIAIGEKYIPPKFCYSCGETFPWVTRAISEAKEFLLLNDIDPDTIASFEKQLINLSREISVEISTLKSKKMISNWNPSIRKGLEGIVVNLLSQPIIKAIFKGG